VRGKIITLGGGGFSENIKNVSIEKYMLSKSGKNKPKICFLPTASGDSEKYIEKFYLAVSLLNCEPSHQSLFKPGRANIREFLLSQDVIYVGGGNTKCMLALWKDWKMDSILKEALCNGTILAGLSAGSKCWFEYFTTDSYHGNLEIMQGLGFLKGSHSAHYDSEPQRRPYFLECIEKELLPAGYALEEGVALYFEDGIMKEIVSERKEGKGFFVEKRGNVAVETELTPVQILV
jgi:dipeptidase E